MQTFTPIEYLKIDVANTFGLDKDDWTPRLNWFDENEAMLLDLFSNDNDGRDKERREFLKQTDEPALCYAGIKAYIAAKGGEAVDYPISLDATASGAQLLSVLIGCEKSAKLCNVVPTGRREDLYTNIYGFMSKRLGEEAGKVSRSDAKQAVMTSLYSSTAVPKRVFGEGNLLDTFYETMEEDATGIWRLNEALIQLWRTDVLAHEWVLPDGFNVVVKVMDKVENTVEFLNSPYTVERAVNQPAEYGRSIGANLIHSIDGMVVREILRRCYHDEEQVKKVKNLCLTHAYRENRMFMDQASTYNERKVAELAQRFDKSGFLSARIVEYIDDQSIMFAPVAALFELVGSMPQKSFPVITVHDCFRVHPNYGNDLRRQYNRILYEIAKSTLLDYTTSQIAGEEMHTPKIDDIAEKILETDYALS